jgi:2-dehydro-3-deoxyglucarate aldolase
MSNKVTIGTWMQIASPSVAEILAANGYDWIAIDAEHGEFSSHNYINMFRAMEKHNCSPYVRIPVGGIHEVKLALDSGAKGIIIPMVRDAAHLTEVMSYAFYPPRGVRGVGFSRASLFGKNFADYVGSINDELFIAAQIENISAVNCIDEILAVEGLDAIMVGPYDLSASMGITAQFNDPKFLAALKRIEDACRKSDVQMGYHIVQPSEAELKKKIDEGYEFIAYGIDALFLNNSSQCPSKE